MYPEDGGICIQYSTASSSSSPPQSSPRSSEHHGGDEDDDEDEDEEEVSNADSLELDLQLFKQQGQSRPQTTATSLKKRLGPQMRPSISSSCSETDLEEALSLAFLRVKLQRSKTL